MEHTFINKTIFCVTVTKEVVIKQIGNIYIHLKTNHHLFISQVYMLPSNPEVTNRLSREENSMFFTQLECPCRVRICVFKFLESQRATVLSSLQVAKTRESKNLEMNLYTQ